MGRIVVITGGTSGIGLKLKEMFEQIGDTVLTFSLDENGSQNHYSGSVSHEIKVRQVFNDIYERFGKIDILVNNAGIGMSAITEIAPLESIKNVMDVNFYGTLYCIRSAIPHMAEGSRIVNMSSAMALFPVPFRSIYGSAKSAVLNLSHSLRMELEPLGIDVVAICPGDTKTNFTANRIKDFETTERYGDRLKTATLDSDAREDKRMSCEYVAEKIFKIINLKKTKPFYIIGTKYKLLYFATRFTPKSLLLKFTAKTLGGRMVESEPKKLKKTKKQKEQPQQQLEETKIETTPVNETVPEVEANHSEETETVETQNVEIQNTEAPKTLNNLLNKISVLNKPETNPSDQTSSQEITINSSTAQPVENNTSTATIAESNVSNSENITTENNNTSTEQK